MKYLKVFKVFNNAIKHVKKILIIKNNNKNCQSLIKVSFSNGKFIVGETLAKLSPGEGKSVAYYNITIII